jgi:hypothetical protein
MILRLISFPAKLAAAGIGLAALGAAAGGGDNVTAGASVSGPLRCEIQATSAGGMTTLEGIVHADVAVAGTYSFHVSGGSNGNSSNISQGGPFSAAPGAPVPLGQVMLGGGRYEASLAVTAGGTVVECAKRI